MKHDYTAFKLLDLLPEKKDNAQLTSHYHFQRNSLSTHSIVYDMTEEEGLCPPVSSSFISRSFGPGLMTD